MQTLRPSGYDCGRLLLAGYRKQRSVYTMYAINTRIKLCLFTIVNNKLLDINFPLQQMVDMSLIVTTCVVCARTPLAT